jgi:hypothetical protein
MRRLETLQQESIENHFVTISLRLAAYSYRKKRFSLEDNVSRTASLLQSPAEAREGWSTPLAPAARIYPMARERRRILFVTSEMSDFVEVGGLGAVSASLPRALRRHCDIRVLLPGYRQVLANSPKMEIVGHLPGAGQIPPCSIGKVATADGLTVYIVLCEELFDRDGCPYVGSHGAEFADNDIRFARLSLAAAQLAMNNHLGWQPEALHLNDWQTALAAGYLAWAGAAVPTLLTLHNLAHQGIFESSRTAALAIPPEAFTIQGVEFFGKVASMACCSNGRFRGVSAASSTASTIPGTRARISVARISTTPAAGRAATPIMSAAPSA